MRVLHKKLIGPCSFCGTEDVDVRISGAIMSGVKRHIFLCHSCAVCFVNEICPLPDQERNMKLVADLREQKDRLSLFMRGELSELLEQAASAIEGLERDARRF